MQCFTFAHGKLEHGIQTTVSEKSGRRIIFFGMKQPRCRYEVVGFIKRGPEVDKNGLIHFAQDIRYPKEFTTKRGKKIVKDKVLLSKSREHRTKYLIRINTSSQIENKINGGWTSQGGWPIPLIKTFGFSHGQKWCDDLIILDDMDVILITPAGGRRTDRMIVRNDNGELSCLPELDYLKILKDHEMNLRRKKSGQSRVHEAYFTTADEEAETNTENLETTNEDAKSTSEPEITGEEGKAQNASEIAIHTEEGQTIGA